MNNCIFVAGVGSSLAERLALSHIIYSFDLFDSYIFKYKKQYCYGQNYWID